MICSCSDNKTPKWRDCEEHKPVLIKDIQQYSFNVMKVVNGKATTLTVYKTKEQAEQMATKYTDKGYFVKRVLKKKNENFR